MRALLSNRAVRLEQIFFGCLFVAIAVLAGVMLWPFLTYIVLAGILTYTLFPVYGFFLRRLGRAELASMLCIVITLLVMVLPSIFLIKELVQQVSGAYTSFKMDSIARITDYLDRITGYRLQEMIDSSLEQLRNRRWHGVQRQLLRSAPQMDPMVLGQGQDAVIANLAGQQ